MSLDNKQMTGASVDDQGSGINHWLRLSDEMALYILRHLPQTSLKTVVLVVLRILQVKSYRDGLCGGGH